MKYMDLHIHSVFSDGTLNPEEIIKIAKQNNLSAIAISDHDTIDGIYETVAAGEKHNMEIVPAIEFSAEHTEALHILGIYIDYKNKALNEKLLYMKKFRKNRLKKFITNLQKLNLDVSYEEFKSLFNINVLGRPHLAAYLVKKKICLSMQDAFKNYIGKKCPAYVHKTNFKISEIIELINNAGGIPILAHPVMLKNFDIDFFIKKGIRGIEAYYYYQTEKDTAFFLEIADKKNLFVTGGSDSHQLNNSNDGLGKFKAPYFHLEKIKNSISV
jgi:3',5'-nucleoside bisphosphate phosphatase